MSCSLSGHIPNVILQINGNNLCPYSLVLRDACAQDKRLTASRVSQVKPENGTDFENVWKNRESKLLEMPGFIRFALLRGDEEGMPNPAVRLSNMDPNIEGCQAVLLILEEHAPVRPCHKSCMRSDVQKLLPILDVLYIKRWGSKCSTTGEHTHCR